MEPYVVSARKYRPLQFEDVVGQDHVTKTLKNAIDQAHLAQSLLFCGPRGVGKTTSARILARLVNDFDADEKSHMNIVELDAASNNSVDDIRQLTDQVRYPPQQGKYKIYIIDEVHMLSTAAFNAFLKTLEEPPSYAIFILATTEKHKILPTILSRCQIYDFNRIGVRDIANHLNGIAKKEQIDVEQDALMVIGEKADGALRDALSIFDLMVTYANGEKLTHKQVLKNLHILDYDYYFKTVEAILTGDTGTLLLLFDEILANGFDGQHYLTGLGSHFRDLLVTKDPHTLKLLQVADGTKERYLQQSQKCNKGFLITCIDITNTFDQSYKTSQNQRLHVELAIVKMAHVPKAFNLADTFKSVKKEIAEGKKKMITQ